MRLPDVLAPVTVEQLREQCFGKQCLLVRRKKKNPLTPILSPEQLETRLNDGVATLAAMTVIGPDGLKLPATELVAQQPTPTWAPRFLRKGKLLELLEGGHSLVLHNMSALTPGLEELVRDIETTFPAHHADVHVYVSPRAGATGYNAHKDEPQHKLYLQLYGSTSWTVFKGSDPRRSMPASEAEELLGVDFRATLTPGSVLYMPPGVFHHATNPDSPRISLSIPFNEVEGAVAVDRTHIPLSSWFA